MIGLEVHAQLKTRTKMFCGCPVEFGGPPNSRTCPVCLGLPGALPTPNREAVRLAVRLALALGCAVQRVSRWARKNYHYPDLPKGYQISQYDRPLAIGGSVRIESPGQAPRVIPLLRVHLEEDAGKLIHEGLAFARSGVDLNRCGAPLIEIVTAPALGAPDEARLFVERLRTVLKATDVSHAELEQGSLRCDANVSVHEVGAPCGARVEIKNLNSLRHLRRALAFEISRQSASLRAGCAVAPETRLWRDAAGETRALRAKEDAADYRYFPDPDLPPLTLSESFLAEAGQSLPEAPHARRDRFVASGVSEADAHRLTLDPDLAAYFECVVAAGASPRAAANWVLSELLGRLRADGGKEVRESPLPAERLAELVRLVEDGVITGKAGKEVFSAAYAGAQPRRLVEELELGRLAADGAVEEACRAALARRPDQVAAYHQGRTGLLQFFVGQVLRETRGRSDPRLVERIVKRMLESAQ